MPFYDWIIVACWAAFIVYWAVSATRAKRSVRTYAWAKSVLARVVIFIVAVILIRFASGTSLAPELRHLAETHPPFALGVLGAACSVAGIGFAIWARTILGRNWGMPQTLREQPELVTTGPYSYVRHPIYTGVLLAVLGSAFATGLFWAVVFVIAAIYFVLSAIREEKDMLALFPDTYPAYKARTKMLVPFVL